MLNWKARVPAALLLLALTSSAGAQVVGPGIRLAPGIRPPKVRVSAAPDATTTGTDEQTLYSYQVPKPTVPNAVWQFRVRWIFTTANTVAAKTSRLRVGSLTGQDLCSTTVETQGALGALMVDCQRSMGVDAMFCTCFGTGSGSGIVANQVSGLDFTQAIPIVITGHTPGGAGELRLSTVRVDGR